MIPDPEKIDVTEEVPFEQLVEDATKVCLAEIRQRTNPNIVVSDATQAWIKAGALSAISITLAWVEKKGAIELVGLDESLTSE